MHDKILKLFFEGCPLLIYPFVGAYVWLYIKINFPGIKVTFYKKDKDA